MWYDKFASVVDNSPDRQTTAFAGKRFRRASGRVCGIAPFLVVYSTLTSFMAMTEQRVSYTLDSSLETIDSAEEKATRIATELGFGDDEVMQISMAVREGAVNAVLHGNAYAPDKKVILAFERTRCRPGDHDSRPGHRDGPEQDSQSAGARKPAQDFRARNFSYALVHGRGGDSPVRNGHRTQTDQARPRANRGRQGGFPVSMKVGSRQVDGVTIVDCSGRITLGEGSVILRDTVRDLLSKGNKKIVLNLADVNYIDSSGIGELVSAFTTTKNQGGELKLLNLTKKVNDLLQITKLYTVFDVKDDEASAVKSFK